MEHGSLLNSCLIRYLLDYLFWSCLMCLANLKQFLSIHIQLLAIERDEFKGIFMYLVFE